MRLTCEPTVGRDVETHGSEEEEKERMQNAAQMT